MIKKELIGAKVFQKGIGTFIIDESKEALYKQLGLDIFEDEIKKGNNKSKRSTNTKGKNDTE